MRETEDPEGQRTEEFVTVQTKEGKIIRKAKEYRTVNRFKRIIDRKKGELIPKKTAKQMNIICEDWKGLTRTFKKTKKLLGRW
jgi:major membrane immunogen (membrane-anchored lipoprotein)